MNTYWKKVSENKPPYGEHVIGFSRKWIDADFNPKGIRECFLTYDGWTSAKYLDTQDVYTTCYSEIPEYYTEILPPIIFEVVNEHK